MRNPFRKRNTVPVSDIMEGLMYRLDKVDTSEVIRWVDNIHTGLGMNVQEMRKSLLRGDSEQALVYMEDMRTGAISLLAAMNVLGLRNDPNWKVGS